MLSPMCKPVMWTLQKQKPLHSFKHMSHTFAFLSVHLKHRRIVRGQNGLKNIEKYSIAEDTYSWQLTAPNQDRGSQRTYGLLISTYHTATDQNPCTLVNIQIAGTWMFICKTKNAEKENIGLDNSLVINPLIRIHIIIPEAPKQDRKKKNILLKQSQIHNLVFYFFDSFWVFLITHRIHGAAIYGNIYHQYTPNVSIYTSTMDPMGYGWPSPSQISPDLLLSQSPIFRQLHISSLQFLLRS